MDAQQEEKIKKTIEANNQDYSKLCDQWEHARQKAAELFDKYALAGAGGGLVLSLTLLSVFGKRPVWPWLLLLSWLLLALAAGCVLLNLLMTYQANKAEICRAKNIMKEYSVNFTTEYDKDRANDPKLNPWIERLNVLALMTIILGVICLLVFGGLNLYRYNTPTSSSSSFSWSMSYDQAHN